MTTRRAHFSSSLMPSGSTEPATADTLGQTPRARLSELPEARDRVLRDRDGVVDTIRGETHSDPGLTGHHVDA